MSLESVANEQATNANAQAEYLKVSSFLQSFTKPYLSTQTQLVVVFPLIPLRNLSIGRVLGPI